MRSPPEGPVCAAHSDVSASFVCERCGDFGCDECRVGHRCRSCAARSGDAATAYAPLARDRVNRAFIPVVVLLFAMSACITFVMTVNDDTAREIGLAFGLLLALAAIPVWIRCVRVMRPNAVQSVRLLLRLRAAGTLYAEGRRAEAAAEMEAICHDAVGYPSVHAMAVQSLGAVSLALGHVDRARDLMKAAARSGWFESFSMRRAGGPTILHGGLALAAATASDREAAEHHAKIARERCPRGKEGMLSYADAFLDARDGRFEDVCELHARRLAALDEGHRKLQEGALTILHGFALEQLGRADEAERAIAGISDAERDGRHASMAVGWPEMSAFLERHRLVPSRAARAAYVDSKR